MIKKKALFSFAFILIITSLAADHNQLLPVCPHPVAITPVDSDQFFLCNYYKLLRVDLSTKEIHELAPPEGVTAWYPSALHYVKNEKRLFIANNTGHNLLELDASQEPFRLIREYNHPFLILPEGIAVSDDGKVVAATDYASGKLLVFSRTGDLLWTASHDLCHGIAIENNQIFISSLAYTMIIKYDFNGNLLAYTGHQGWGPNEYLWPTGLCSDGNLLFVSDPHTGKISILDYNLNWISSFGNNGPGLKLCNMPYGLTSYNDNLILTDTYKQRLVIYDKKGNFLTSYGINSEEQMESGIPHGLLFAGYGETQRLFDFHIPGIEPNSFWMNSYRYYVNRKSKQKIALNTPPPFSWYPDYFTFHAIYKYDNQNYSILGCSQSNNYLIVDSLGRPCRFTLPPGCSLWQNNDKLIDDTGSDKTVIQNIAVAHSLLQHYDQLLAQGIPLLEALKETFWPELSQQEIYNMLENNFISHSGKKFWARFIKSPKQGKHEREKYFKKIKDLKLLHLQEILVVNLIGSNCVKRLYHH